MRTILRPWLLAAALLAGCGTGPADAGGSPAPLGAPLTITRSPAEAAVVAAGEAFFDACRTGDAASVGVLLDSRLAAEPWSAACGALAGHATHLLESSASVAGDDARFHITLALDDRELDDDWSFHRTAGGWILSRVPDLLLGGWDADDHHWLSATVNSTGASGVPAEATTGGLPTGTTVAVHAGEEQHDDGTTVEHQGATAVASVAHDEDDPGH